MIQRSIAAGTLEDGFVWFSRSANMNSIGLIGRGQRHQAIRRGKTDMRKMLTPEQIEYNCDCFKTNGCLLILVMIKAITLIMHNET